MRDAGIVLAENVGQCAGPARFVVRRDGFTGFLLDDGFVVAFAGPEAKAASVSFVFEGAAPGASLEGAALRPGAHHYYRGGESASWRTSVPLFREAVRRELLPGIDLEWREREGRLEYDVVVAPGADPREVVVRVEGAESLQLDADGSLVIETVAGRIRQSAPVTFERRAGGATRPVRSRYRLLGGDRFGFEAVRLDPEASLVIDPGVMLWGSFIGDLGADLCTGVAVSRNMGFSHVTGATQSLAFPVTPGAFDTTLNNSNAFSTDGFVSKMSPIGRQLVWSTFLGGDGNDAGRAIAVSPTDQVYVTGWTDSPKGGPNQVRFPSINEITNTMLPIGGGDTFIAKFNATGGMQYITRFHASGLDEGQAIALAPNGDPLICGRTQSTDLPVTPGVVGPTFSSGLFDAFVVGLLDVSSGAAASFITYLGSAPNPASNDIDEANGIALDANQNVWVTGWTDGLSFPVTLGAAQSTIGGGAPLLPPADAFLVALNPSATVLAYSTYYGGEGDDRAFGITVHPTNGTYIVGETRSVTLPVTPGAFSSQLNQGAPSLPPPPPPWDGFLARFSALPVVLTQYSSYLGGPLDDAARGVVADNSFVFVTGATNSPSGIAFGAAPFQPTLQGPSDAFLARFTAAGAGSLATYLGGSATGGLGFLQDEVGFGVDLDGAGGSYVAGVTYAVNFPVTPLAFDVTYGGSGDGFLVKFQ